MTGFKLNLSGVAPNEVDDKKPEAVPPTPKQAILDRLAAEASQGGHTAAQAAASTGFRLNLRAEGAADASSHASSSLGEPSSGATSSAPGTSSAGLPHGASASSLFSSSTVSSAQPSPRVEHVAAPVRPKAGERQGMSPRTQARLA